MKSTEDFLNEFVLMMKQILKKHEVQKSNNWMFESEHVLLENLFQEIHEFKIKNDPEYELIDIANSCFLLWTKRKYFKEV